MVFFIGRTFFFSHQKKNQKGWCFSWYCFGCFLLFKVYFFFTSSWFGFRRPFRGCSAFFGWSSFAAALVVSLLPPAEGRLDRRLGVVIAFSFVDKICLFVDFICIYADIFVTL